MTYVLGYVALWSGGRSRRWLAGWLDICGGYVIHITYVKIRFSFAQEFEVGAGEPTISTWRTQNVVMGLSINPPQLPYFSEVWLNILLPAGEREVNFLL